MVGQAIQQHLESQNPNKALALAFLGGTGRGKTFLTTLIAKTLYKNGEKSLYYHKFIGVDRLSDDEAEARDFSAISWIKGNLTECAYNVFVFDEMDKFPRVVIDSLLEFIDFDAKTYGKENSRKSIFIFLSNSATRIIDGEIYKHIYESQKSRESIRYENLKQSLREAAFNDGLKFSGLRHSEIVRKSLINYYIPFLPLQKAHILQCVNAYIKKYNENSLHKIDLKLSVQEKNRIVDEMEYSPEENPLFSKLGCATFSFF
uniref:AAA+ ATPase domain-containing protein n=1 Tax=Panagrolaimus sp. ES5 TaxID=591445 RepID=A0AC34GAC3_9BILA